MKRPWTQSEVPLGAVLRTKFNAPCIIVAAHDTELVAGDGRFRYDALANPDLNARWKYPWASVHLPWYECSIDTEHYDRGYCCP